MNDVAHLTSEDILRAMDGELNQAERVRMETHLGSCEACLERYEQWASLSDTVNHRIRAVSIGAPLAARDGLKRALDARPMLEPKRNGRWQWIAAAAALIALLFLVSRRGPDVGVRPREVAPVETPRMAAVPETVRQSSQWVEQKKPSRSVHPATAQYRNSFVPLPYSDPSLPVNSADVIRVQMRLSSLTSAGIVRARPGIGDPLIQADLLLGMDGRPSAIRVLQPGSAD